MWEPSARRLAVYVAQGLKQLGEVYLRRRRPFVLNHLVTVRCNMACPFYYVSGPEQIEFNREHYSKRSEMDTAEMCDFYRQLVALDFKLAVIVGGEPLLRKDLDQMLAVLAGHVYVSVFTNGILLAERLELLERATSLFVSLDAPDEEHDTLRNRPGSFRLALEGIEAMQRRLPKIKVALNMTVTGQNVHRVREMLRFAREMGLPIAFQPPSYKGQFALDSRPSTDSGQALPPPDLLTDAFRAIRSAAQRQPVIGSGAFFDLVIQNRPYYPCSYPSYVLGPVLPNGDVVGCIDNGMVGNIREAKVGEILAGAPFQNNAEAAESCRIGCRDWGIHDLSAIDNRTFGLTDMSRYYRTFVGWAR